MPNGCQKTGKAELPCPTLSGLAQKQLLTCTVPIRSLGICSSGRGGRDLKHKPQPLIGLQFPRVTPVLLHNQPIIREREGERAALTLAVFQVAHGHLQNVRFFQLGIGLVPLEFIFQEPFQLLDAGIDAVPAQLLHQGLAQLQGEKERTPVSPPLALPGAPSSVGWAGLETPNGIVEILTLFLSLEGWISSPRA